MNGNKKAMVIFLISIPGIIWSGFIIKTLWVWFIVPLGVIEISLPHAIGIDMLITFLTASSYNIKDKTITEIITMLIGRSVMFLFMGFIATLFM